MNEDKPKLKNQGFCIFHQKYWDAEVGRQTCCPLCMQKHEEIQSPPTPPTPRPDVERILSNITDPDIKGGVHVPLTHEVITVCDYTLDLEKRLREVERTLSVRTSLLEVVTSHRDNFMVELDTVNSLLADLVAAAKKRVNAGHEQECFRRISPGGKDDDCICGHDELTTALTAAQQHFEKEKK